MMSEKTPTPSSHASRPPHWVRSARAVGEESRYRRGGALSWAASRPWPMSRRRSIRAATARGPAWRARARSSSHWPARRRTAKLLGRPSGVVQAASRPTRCPRPSAGAARRRAPRRRSAVPCAASARPGWRPRPRRRRHGSGEDERDREEDRGPRPGTAGEDPASSASHTIAAPIAIPRARSRTPRRGSPARRGRAPGGGVLLGAQRAQPRALARLIGEVSRHATRHDM